MISVLVPEPETLPVLAIGIIGLTIATRSRSVAQRSRV